MKVCGEECEQVKRDRDELRSLVMELVGAVAEHAPGKLPQSVRDYFASCFVREYDKTETGEGNT